MARGTDSLNLPIEESRRLIDLKRTELYKLIRQLNSGRNELAPISALPPEVLGQIFTLVVPERDPNDQNYSPSKATSFAYVSQQWRNVALDTPGLWNTPTFNQPKWGRAMLERSKMADLLVHCDTSLIAASDLLKEVFDNHAARIRELDLRGLKSSSLLSSLLKNVRPSSLCLRSLYLFKCNSESENQFVPGKPDFPVFPVCLLVQPENLKRLTIEDCAFDVFAQQHPRLTHLTVVRPCNRPLLSEFVAALSEMPALETLKMICSLPLATKAVKLGFKVELPTLSFLDLSSSDSFFEVLNVLDFLVIPWTSMIQIYCTEKSSKQKGIKLPDIGPPLEIFFSSMTGDVEKKSYNRLTLHTSFGLGLLSAQRNELDDPLSTGKSDLVLQFRHSEYRESQILHEIFPYIPLSGLQTLGTDTGQDNILIYFSKFTTIQTVELQFKTVTSFYHALIQHNPAGYGLFSPVPFPALQSLEFYKVTDIGPHDFVSCLMKRSERGVHLKKFSVRQCEEIDDDDLEPLREIVPDVEWESPI